MFEPDEITRLFAEITPADIIDAPPHGSDHPTVSLADEPCFARYLAGQLVRSRRLFNDSGLVPDYAQLANASGPVDELWRPDDGEDPEFFAQVAACTRHLSAQWFFTVGPQFGTIESAALRWFGESSRGEAVFGLISIEDGKADLVFRGSRLETVGRPVRAVMGGTLH